MSSSSDERLESQPSASIRVAIVPGVTLTKWSRAWQDRRPDVPLVVIPVSELDQVSVLRGGMAELAFVRMPIDATDMSVIPLYREVPVAVVAKDHPIAVFDSVTNADLEGEVELHGSLDDDLDLIAAGGGIRLLPQSVARQHARKDVVACPISDADETQIAIAWLTERNSADIEEFVGIVRGRTAASSRGSAMPIVSSKREKPRSPRPPMKRGKKVKRPRGR